MSVVLRSGALANKPLRGGSLRTYSSDFQVENIYALCGREC